MLLKKYFILLLLLTNTTVFLSPRENYLRCQKPFVPVTGYAKAFVGDQRIQNAMITILGTKKTVKTDRYGRFAFCIRPGKLITLELSKDSNLPWDNYKRTQIGSFIVPKEGFYGLHHELTFQVPRKITFSILKFILTSKKNIKLDNETCQVATTITALGKTLNDDVQGEAGAQIIVSHHGKVLQNLSSIYFGILLNKTNPFVLYSHHSSLDGGVLIVNLPASNELYKISAKKYNKHFTSEYILCRPGAFINLSPPHGVNVK